MTEQNFGVSIAPTHSFFANKSAILFRSFAKRDCSCGCNPFFISLPRAPVARAPRRATVAVFHCRAPSPHHLRGLIARSICHAVSLPCGPVAVGRDVPIAPPRHGAVRGLASRSLAPHPRAPRDHTLARARCHSPNALPVRRDGDIAPYRHYTREIHTRRRAVFFMVFNTLSSKTFNIACGDLPLPAGHPSLCVPIHPVLSLFVILCVKTPAPSPPHLCPWRLATAVRGLASRSLAPHPRAPRDPSLARARSHSPNALPVRRDRRLPGLPARALPPLYPRWLTTRPRWLTAGPPAPHTFSKA